MKVFLQTPNITRDQVIEYITNGPVRQIIGRRGIIDTLDVLTSDGSWVHVENGVVQ